MIVRTVCHSCMVDTTKAVLAKNRFGEFVVCNSGCKDFIEAATDSQMAAMLSDRCDTGG